MKRKLNKDEKEKGKVEVEGHRVVMWFVCELNGMDLIDCQTSQKQLMSQF
jgi:hypothetical protein